MKKNCGYHLTWLLIESSLFSLDRVQRRLRWLMGEELLIALQSLSHRRDVFFFTLPFYIYFIFFHPMAVVKIFPFVLLLSLAGSGCLTRNYCSLPVSSTRSSYFQFQSSVSFCPYLTSNHQNSLVIINNSKFLNFDQHFITTLPPKKCFSVTVNLCKKSNAKRHALFLLSLLVLSGNVELKPGTSFKYPCGTCSRPCRIYQPSIFCDSSNICVHKKCLKLSSLVFFKT